MAVLAPDWIAPLVTVTVFVVTTALGFLLMRVGFNMRPQWERRPDRDRTRTPAGTHADADTDKKSPGGAR